MRLSSPRSQFGDDESIIREQVLSTHNYDGRSFNTNFILSIVENILSFKKGTAQEAMVEKLNQLGELNHKELSCHIRQLLLEIALSGLNAANQHCTTINVMSMLCSYCWEDKLVLMLAAFSIIYGFLSLVSRFRKQKGLAQKLGHLNDQTPSDNHKAVDGCISSVIQLTKCVAELKQCPSYSPPQSLVSALPVATYWIATSVVSSAACVHTAHSQDQTVLGELTTLMTNIHATFSPELAKKKADESFEALRYALYHNSFNKLEVLKLMFNAKDNNEEIIRNTGLNEWKDDPEVLLLITSGFDISNKWIDFLNWFYGTSRPHIIWIPITQNTEASWTSEDEKNFAKLKQRINFYWLNDPQKELLPQFIRFVKEELFPNFWMGEEPIIVSVDLQGRIVHSNAAHMILTWGPDYIEENTIGVQKVSNITPLIANELKEGTSGVSRIIPEIDQMRSDFLCDIDKKINAWKYLIEEKIQKAIKESTPYDSEREKNFWQQETTWSLLLVAPKFGPYNDIGEPIDNWIQEGKYIFLYGGNSIKWIRDFTSKVHEVSSNNTQLKIELVYVGKNKMIRAAIIEKRMSHCALDRSYTVWLFWTRLWIMFLSRIRYLNAINHFDEECNDEILRGLKKLLAYEGKNTIIEGWALLSKGKEMVVCGHGAKMLQVINDYDIWKENIATKGFDQSFKDHHELLASSSSLKSHSCCTLEYPTILNKIPKNEKCPECSCRMHKFVTFTCSHDH